MNHDPNPIILVSTRTVDRLPRPDGYGIEEIPGGPATYVGEALRRLGAEYRLITGDVAIVDVVPGEAGQQEYVIPPLTPIRIPPNLKAPAVILSPIMREISPDAVPDVQGLLVLDLQGFVRDPNKLTNHVRKRVNLCRLIECAHIVKASVDEVQRLTSRSQDALAGRTVIVTQGAKGALVLEAGRETFVPARAVHARHSIGAGDTFLAALVVHSLCGASPVTATTRAARFTEAILSEREASQNAQ
ncbi:MAG: hypothetical protein NVSMB52_15870 [Chloroflexota bacterium]